MKVLFAGGGTLGPVTPLLAVAQAWKKQDPGMSFVWAGTPQGPECAIVERENIPFFAIPVARFPRYFSLEWFRLPFVFLMAFWKSWFLLSRQKPDVIACAGGYTSVPVVIAGWFKGIPAWIHQPDLLPLLTNRLLAPFAKRITVAWPETANAFPSDKTFVLGNPVRPEVQEGSVKKAVEMFSLDASLPTVLVLGGGGGSQWINRMMEELVPRLLTCAQVIHQTGKGKEVKRPEAFGERYHVRELLTEEFPHALAVADFVLCRAGMGTLTELAACRKPAILIPLPDSPQEANAKKAQEIGGALRVNQKTATVADLWQAIKVLLDDQEQRQRLGERWGKLFATDVAQKMIEMLQELGVGVRKK
jgi:UDP-N-acetylglucosamine--N-acetylmuramyl-(pentapeptide) pyrophosphoryl-undecaprenol N-acetylglucosamine transferase